MAAAMVGIPSLSALSTASLSPPADVDASTARERLAQWWNPWRLEFSESVEGDATRGLQHVIRITARDGSVSRQRDMLEALSAKFNPIFGQRFRAMPNNGKLYTTCTDKTKSTLEWAYAQPYGSSLMPDDGIPLVSAMPGGSISTFLKLAFGPQPVELAEALYTWEPAPFPPRSLFLEAWILKRQGDVGEEDLGYIERLRRATLGEGVGQPVGVRPSRR